MTPTRLDNVVENLIWAANENEIQCVVSNGEIVINSYEFVKLPVQDVLQQVQELSEMFCEYKKHRIPEKTTGIRDSI